jgi:hypothetical protein
MEVSAAGTAGQILKSNGAAAPTWVDLSSLGDGAYIRRDGTNSPSADIPWNSKKITGLADPAAAQDAATKNYVDTTTTANPLYVRVNGSTPLTANWDVGAFTVSSSAQNAFQVKPYGAAAGNTSEIRFNELAANGANYVGFKAPDTLAGNVIWKLPTADGTSGQILSTDGSGQLQWANAGAGEANDGANVGATGVGIYDGKTGTTINMRKVDAGSNKISVALNGQKVDVDVNEANLTLSNLGGIVPLAKGGSNKNMTPSIWTRGPVPRSAQGIVRKSGLLFW